MAAKSFSSELDIASARSDSDDMIRTIDAYAAYWVETDGASDWPEDQEDAFGQICGGLNDDPNKALTYVVLGASRSDHPGFIACLGCGPLEDILREPSEEMIQRIVAEARKSARFRWLLSHPFKVAVSEAAWLAIERFRITGPHEEPPLETMPTSYFG